MIETRTSKLLSEIIEEAKKIGGKNDQPFTAERFLVVLINRLENCTARTEVELIMAGGKLKEHIKNFAEAKKIFLEYAALDDCQTIFDDLYMKKMLRRAAIISENRGVADCVSLVICIMKTPSYAVDKAIKQCNPVDVIIDNEPEDNDGTQPGSELSGDDLLAALIEQNLGITPSKKSSSENVGRQSDSSGTESKPTAESSTGGQSFDGDSDEDEDVKQEMMSLITDVQRIRASLQDAIFGQDNAINVFTTGYFRARMMSMTDSFRTRPQATFLFAGPPGVGKTFFAENAAKALNLPFMRFDMSEYADKEANIEFCGADKVYKSAKEGNVTGFVAKNPRCLLLFDEIEKAHINVIHLFLQMLDAGRLRDNYTDQEVSFKDTIIILTTNAGKQLYEDSDSKDFSTVSRKIIIKALQRDVNPETGVPYFPGAICSRFASGNVVMFNHIMAHNLWTIAKKEIGRHVKNLESKTGIKISIDHRVYTALLLSEGSAADARTIRGRAEAFFNDELYELLRFVKSEKVMNGTGSVSSIDVSVDLADASSEIRELFEASEKAKVLIFASPELENSCRAQLGTYDIIGARDADSALEAVKNGEVGFAMVDLRYGAAKDSFGSLNVEDVDSPVRDFLKLMREQKCDLPIYIIEEKGAAVSKEERVSFLRQGIRGFLSVDDGKLLQTVDEISVSIHQQSSMIKLARENKLVSFESAQAIGAEGQAKIRLFDFEMSVAVDSEDAGNILNAVSRPNVHFQQVIGAENAKKELTYFVEYLKNPKKYLGTGVKAPKGVLLYGPPGTGKTMLAKAMACEAGVTFIAAEGNQFLKKFVGEGSEKVHELFRTARKYAPAILFIDEIDAIAKERRGNTESGASGEETLTAFLTEMDGFASDPTRPVFVLAATNFEVEPGSAKSLDAALMRRFDRRIYIDLPNKQDRIRFLNMKIAGNKALDISERQVDNIAMRATGMSLAQLDSVVELALRSAIREGSTKVTDAILEEAFETFNSGDAKKWDESQLERVARHESGHALLCYLGEEAPSYLTIVARGNHGGYMQHSENEGKAIYTKDELLARIRTALGGRAAEIVYYGDKDGISTGASGDLASATNIARQIVCSYGMDEDFGLAVVSSGSAENGAMSQEVRQCVNRILKEQMQEAIRLISENRCRIDALVDALMVKNHLNGDEIERTILGASAN